MSGETSDTRGEVVESRLAHKLEVLEHGRGASEHRLVGRHLTYRHHGILDEHAFREYDVKGYVNAFLLELVLYLVQGLAEQLVVSFDGLRVLSWSLGLGFRSNPIKPLPDFFRVEASLTVRNYELRSSKEAYPITVNRAEQVLRRLSWQH